MKKMDLMRNLQYPFSVTGATLPVNQISDQGLPTMKLAIQIFALSVAVAGVAAASVSPKTASAMANHLSATASMPAPCCGPHMYCPAGVR